VPPRSDGSGSIDEAVVTTTERLAPRPAEVGDAGPEAGDGQGVVGGESGHRVPPHRLRALLVAAGLYLVLALVVWWHVWTGHPTVSTTCGCGDSSLFTWFIDWPAYAIRHGLNPLYSTAMFHPTGVNLLSNTAVVAIGVVLAPVTWVFGPVASLNIALTLSPALSALAMYVLLRRWVSWAPAAFVGGLFYGFSPFILVSLTDAHLMLGMAPIPPLIVACLDELLVRQRRRAWVTGVVLGLLVTVQFFIGTEVLVLTALTAGIGVLLVVLWNLAHLEVLRRRTRHAVEALAAAAVTAGVLLAYPIWFVLDGPAHLAGPIWGFSYISYGGTSHRDYLLPSPASTLATSLGHQFGGYQAPTLSPQYFGLGLVAVLVVGLVVWRRDVRLWLFAAVAAASILLSSGLSYNSWTPWRLFEWLPQMDNIIPSRFLLITYVCAAVMLGLVVDHTYALVGDRVRRRPGREGARAGAGPWAAVVAAVVALIAVVPVAWYWAGGLPLTVQPVVLPTWFRTVAPHLDQHQVVLAFPVPFDLYQSSLTWQAVDGMSFAMAGGSGPGSLLARAGSEESGQNVIGVLSTLGSPDITTDDILAVREALQGWGVTMVVIPDRAGLPHYEQLPGVRTTTVLMSAAIGRAPVRQAGAWVWSGVDQAGPPVLAVNPSHCVRGQPLSGTVASIDRSVACVLSSPVSHR
jgi:hypothetical protein